MSKEYMGLREYSYHRGCNLKAVQKAIESERISYYIVKVKKKIKPEEADRQWEANTAITPSNIPNNPEITRGPSYQQSRAIREAYQAKLAKLEYEEKAGKLIDAEIVKRESFEEGRRIRDTIMNVPGRVSGLLNSCKSAFEMEQVLDRELIKALELLSNE